MNAKQRNKRMVCQLRSKNLKQVKKQFATDSTLPVDRNYTIENYSQHMKEVENIIEQYINESRAQKVEYKDIKDSRLSDFEIESLELFEMLLAIEEIIGKEIPDSILSAEIKIGELVAKILDL